MGGHLILSLNIIYNYTDINITESLFVIKF